MNIKRVVIACVLILGPNIAQGIGPIIINTNQARVSTPTKIRLHCSWTDVVKYLPSIDRITILRSNEISPTDLHNDKEINQILKNQSHVIYFPSVIKDSKFSKFLEHAKLLNKDEGIKTLKEMHRNPLDIVFIIGDTTSLHSTKQDPTLQGFIKVSGGYLKEIINNDIRITKLEPKLPSGFIINNSKVDLVLATDDQKIEVVFKATFYERNGFWYLNNSMLLLGESTTRYPLYYISCGSHSNMKTPSNFCFICKKSIFTPSSNGDLTAVTEFVLEDMQLQPYYYNGRFGKQNDCTCYMTTVMWMALGFILIFVYFIGSALSTISQIEGPSRFPDPSSKSIFVPDT
ncbi:hypothetical protein GJ496_011991 [Pomphorhynchus laevis]|nr:hypothetical protein GJ496_011991 [Pomphorhynchus laevis]